MIEKVRTFICVEIPFEIRRELSAFQDGLKSVGGDIKWVRPESIHLTLKFLGDVDKTRIGDLAELIRNSIQEFKPFPASFGHTGTFPNSRRPNVIWVGVIDGKESLQMIAHRLNQSLIDMGFEEEKRKYHPHLTIGRVRSMRKIRETIELLSSVPLREYGFQVQELVLMKSDLQSTGAIYTPLEHFKLQGE